MYELVKIKDKIRVPPGKFKSNLDESILAITQEEYEGLLDEDMGIVIAVVGAKKLGEGRVILGDGAAYYEAELKMLVYKPKLHEVVEGKISELTEFGTFVRIGPIDGLIHVSQLMDEFMNYDAKNQHFVGKESGRKIVVEDTVLARIVTVSLKGSISDSKIGLTMRQPYLGKWEWIEKEIKEGGRKKPEKTEKGKKDRPEEADKGKREKPEDEKKEKK